MGTDIHLRRAMRAYRSVLARLLTCALALAVVALLALPACTTQAPPAPTPTTGANLSLTSVALLSAQDGWVVSAGSMVPPAYELHLQQGVWIRVPLGDSADGLNKVVLLSPTDGWAVGENVYHFDGTRWMRVYASHRPQVQELGLTDVAFLSPTEGWAVGWGGILHYHGGQWTDVSADLPQVPTPTPGTTYTGPGLRALALVSPTEGWAVGNRGVIWRYDGTGWQPTSAFDAPDVHTQFSDEALYAVRCGADRTG